MSRPLLSGAVVRLGRRPGLVVRPSATAGVVEVVEVGDGAHAARVATSTPARATLVARLSAGGGTESDRLLRGGAGGEVARVGARSVLHSLARRGLLPDESLSKKGPPCSPGRSAAAARSHAVAVRAAGDALRPARGGARRTPSVG